VTCQDYGEPQLKSEIIIFLRALKVNFKPIYFEFKTYEFNMVERSYDGKPFKLKLINDNLKISKVDIVELEDPFNLLRIDLTFYEEFLFK
jgi:hypothetical protein